MARELEPYQNIERSIIKKFRKEIWRPFIEAVQRYELVNDCLLYTSVSCYADIIVMRHPKEGAPLCASMYSKIPVINAGDGGHNHPTQTLIDLMTIRQRLGRLDNLTIGFCGDLKFGRTVHSLVKSLVRHTGNKFYFISPEELRLSLIHI